MVAFMQPYCLVKLAGLRVHMQIKALETCVLSSKVLQT